MKKFAVITGASKGIGANFAKILYKKGYNLILVARDQEALKKLQSELHSYTLNLQVEILALDLSVVGSTNKIYEFCLENKYDVEILINNAGVGVHSEHVTTTEESVHSMINLNIVALTDLCRDFGFYMKSKKSGYILNIASLAAFQPVPYIAAYAASKAYVLNFSESLAKELEDFNVSVTCFSPGHTNTNFFDTAGIDIRNKFYGMPTRANPQDVAESAIKSMFAKDLSKVFGLKNTLLSWTSRFSTRSLTAKISKMLVR